MNLSIIIVNWNTRDLVTQCLDSVYAHPPAGDFEVIVVDNASADGSATMVRARFPQVVLIENEENVGFARANNQAIRTSKGEFLLLLNSDALLLVDTVERLLGIASNQPETGIIGIKLLNPDGSFQASFNDFPTLRSESLSVLGLARFLYSPYFPSYPPSKSLNSQYCDWVPGACFLVRRAATKGTGLLDEGFFFYAEEMDWCFRMWQNGWKVFYSADTQAIHKGGKVLI